MSSKPFSQRQDVQNAVMEAIADGADSVEKIAEYVNAKLHTEYAARTYNFVLTELRKQGKDVPVMQNVKKDKRKGKQKAGHVEIMDGKELLRNAHSKHDDFLFKKKYLKNIRRLVEHPKFGWLLDGKPFNMKNLIAMDL